MAQADGFAERGRASEGSIGGQARLEEKSERRKLVEGVWSPTAASTLQALPSLQRTREMTERKEMKLMSNSSRASDIMTDSGAETS